MSNTCKSGGVPGKKVAALGRDGRATEKAFCSYSDLRRKLNKDRSRLAMSREYSCGQGLKKIGVSWTGWGATARMQQ